MEGGGGGTVGASFGAARRGRGARRRARGGQRSPRSAPGEARLKVLAVALLLAELARLLAEALDVVLLAVVLLHRGERGAVHADCRAAQSRVKLARITRWPHAVGWGQRTERLRRQVEVRRHGAVGAQQRLVLVRARHLAGRRHSAAVLAAQAERGDRVAVLPEDTLGVSVDCHMG